MRLKLSAVALLAFTLGLTQAEAQKESEDSTVYRERIFTGINELRVQRKAPALKRHPKLDAAAQKHVENMARKDMAGDDGKGHLMDGKRGGARIIDEGYAWDVWSENVSLAQPKGNVTKINMDIIVKGWDQSPGHHKNLNNPAFTETGIGAARSKSGKWYFCQVFAKPAK